MIAHTIHTVTSRDGTTIGYRELGSGPGLLCLHGGGFASNHYLDLAERLSGAFTVILPDGRGRGLSGAFPPGYNMTHEVEDLQAVMADTGACMAFGHSRGAIVTLEAARTLALKKIALYEPPVFTAEQPPYPVDWQPAFERKLRKGDKMGAQVAYMRGMQMNAMAKLPPFILGLMMSMILKGEHRQEAFDLLPTILTEMRMVQTCEPRSERYQALDCETLLLSGSKSPAYFNPSFAALVSSVPRISHHVFPGFDHGSPIFGDPGILSATLLDFFNQDSAQ